jgi:hypothetical protein
VKRTPSATFAGGRESAAAAFEAVALWARGRELGREVLALTQDGTSLGDPLLRGQVRSAAFLAMTSLSRAAAGAGMESDRLVATARAAYGELRSLLFIAEDAGCLTATQAERLREKAGALVRALAAAAPPAAGPCGPVVRP